MINIVISPVNSGDLTDRQIKTIALETLSKLGKSENLELEIIFVDKEDIEKLNKKYREINKPTDVLSFPQTHFESSKLNLLGSIVICQEVIKEKEELLEDIIKHGLLHLSGYDHETDVAKWEAAAKIINCKL
ncbi:MAG: rRNA maturation RNase YbeY [Patescibacteria group bacterium]|nr:rRNA maturation RNase YbeY [Patescibacteria group bacterium]